MKLKVSSNRLLKRPMEKWLRRQNVAVNTSRYPWICRIEVIHEFLEHKLTCTCGCRKRPIGEKVSEQLEVVPMQIRVIKHIRKNLRLPWLRNCAKDCRQARAAGWRCCSPPNMLMAATAPLQESARSSRHRYPASTCNQLLNRCAISC